MQCCSVVFDVASSGRKIGFSGLLSTCFFLLVPSPHLSLCSGCVTDMGVQCCILHNFPVCPLEGVAGLLWSLCLRFKSKTRPNVPVNETVLEADAVVPSCLLCLFPQLVCPVTAFCLLTNSSSCRARCKDLQLGNLPGKD